jgi:hypothetical protein
MRTFFAISMLGFFTLLAAVLALVKKVYQSQCLLKARTAPPFEAPVQHTMTRSGANPDFGLRLRYHQSVQELAPQKSPDWRFTVHGGRP